MYSFDDYIKMALGGQLPKANFGANLQGIAQQPQVYNPYANGQYGYNYNQATEFDVNNPNQAIGVGGKSYNGFGPQTMAFDQYFADGGATHPNAEYEAEAGEVIYHPNDRPVPLKNGGGNTNATDYTKITGNKHSSSGGGSQWKGGKDGYIFSDQIKMAKGIGEKYKNLL